MIWLTWRQHRKQALFAIAGLAVLAAILVPTGMAMHDRIDDTGVRACVDTLGQAEFVDRESARTCEDAAAAFGSVDSFLLPAVLLVILPMVAGMFWGATLVAREVEHGTHRLIWTQGVTRTRWLLVKVGLVAAGATVVAAAYGMLAAWWVTPVVLARTSRMQLPLFDIAGLAPVGYTVFAVALGVFAGALSRKVLPAMATTMVGFAAVRIALVVGLRPRFRAPREVQFPVATESVPNEFRGDWILSQTVYDEAGNVESSGVAFCDGPGCTPGRYNVWTYQPSERFGQFQAFETGILVGVSMLLILLAVYLVRRRIS